MYWSTKEKLPQGSKNFEMKFDKINRFEPFSIFGLTDDSWLNLTDQDLENMLSKYRDLNSRKTGRDTHTNTPNHNVCTSSNF